MATVKISQLGQQTASLPFWEVVVGTKRYIVGTDSGNLAVAKPASWLGNMGFAATLVAKFSDHDADLKAALNLGAYNETQRDNRFPVADLGAGHVYVAQFDTSTDWKEGGPKDTKTITGGTAGTTTTTTGTTTTTTGGTTTTTGGGTTTTGGGTTTLFSAGDTGTTIESFLSKYWWAVLLIVVALLWKPIIAPALGIRTSRRRR
ncbi:hypothetical protein GCM10028807_50010 [Spirosoma daeguense]